MRVHYPRTPHLPWSPGVTPDDVRAGDLSGLRGREVVVTEKLDGENTTLYADGMHARSLDSAHHPSRAWVKGLQGRIGGRIPAGWRVCGENMYARHSIAYQGLESWFYGFSVWDGDRCLDWDRTVTFLRGLGIPAPPVLWRGVFDERALRGLRLNAERQEGYVVRAVEGFGREEFAGRVAKWVRREHVQTSTHWMHATVVPNALGPGAALWSVRSGADCEVNALLASVDLSRAEAEDLARAEAGDVARAEAEDVVPEAVAEVSARLDVIGRWGDARLAGVLAVALRSMPRARLAARLARPLGMRLARRVADLAGLHGALRRPYPDEERRAGLGRMALAADLGVLHAVAAAVLAGRVDDEADQEREQVEWSALHAEDAGLLGPGPLELLRAGLREALADLGGEAADRCWAEARDAWARGRVTTVEEAVAATWRWRSGRFPRLVQLVGPSGSGKSTFAAGLPEIDAYLSLDDLRDARGSRADQRANREVLGEGLARLDAALAAGGTVVWDATSLNQHQRSLVHAVARRRDALTTHAVALVEEDELHRRNARRAHPVPPQVLATQVRRFVPPYPGQAHRTWYVGASGTVEDLDGALDRGEA
ncbi:RNA ligase family protein [Nonomuraea sp. NEAU-A123]|uniref:RNA ligase family protein n=1 Tax=Nonomuraea sp. NEAU-A123 TaxID=2839649 RepID=UPI001BE3D9C4|nr:RNA ligase family protein [Nonomuraea sp. NEAU-A123]MBT2229399.1 AAA family ATPase [Nonomuraea sp. NEAU-A123]